MEPHETSSTYREHSIVFNPSGNSTNALTDAFMILTPTGNPMLISMLYEHSGDKVQTYSTEEEAYAAAMTQAHAWIDVHLDATANPASDGLTRSWKSGKVDRS